MNVSNNSDGGLARFATGLALVGSSLIADWFLLSDAPARLKDKPAIPGQTVEPRPSNELIQLEETLAVAPRPRPIRTAPATPTRYPSGPQW